MNVRGDAAGSSAGGRGFFVLWAGVRGRLGAEKANQRQRTGVSAPHRARGRRPGHFARSFGGVGVLRLRSCFASRSGYSAQDDISPERWAQPLLHIRLLLRFSSSRDGFAGFLVGGAAALGFALVPHLFAFGEG